MSIWRHVSACIVATLLSVQVHAQPQNLEPIITFDQSHPLRGQVSVFPMVRVFATGDVLVYRAVGFKSPGEHALKLNEAQLSELKTLAQQAGVAQFDASELQQISAVDNNGRVTISSDPTTSIFEFNRVAGANTLSAGDGTTTDAMQMVVLEDVPESAAALPGSASLDALNELYLTFVELYSRAGL